MSEDRAPKGTERKTDFDSLKCQLSFNELPAELLANLAKREFSCSPNPIHEKSAQSLKSQNQRPPGYWDPNNFIVIGPPPTEKIRDHP